MTLYGSRSAECEGMEVEAQNCDVMEAEEKNMRA